MGDGSTAEAPAICGYHGKILHVDLGARTARIVAPDERVWRRYVGGGLLATWLLRDTPPRRRRVAWGEG